jgi:hypothetical protein
MAYGILSMPECLQTPCFVFARQRVCRGGLNGVYDELIKPALAMLGDADKSAVLQADLQFKLWPHLAHAHPYDIYDRRSVTDLVTDLRMILVSACLSTAAYESIWART